MLGDGGRWGWALAPPSAPVSLEFAWKVWTGASRSDQASWSETMKKQKRKQRRKREGYRLFGSARAHCGSCAVWEPLSGGTGPREIGLSG